MKKVSIILAVLLVIAIAVSAAGCGKTEGNSLTGTWEYLDKETGISAKYVLKDDGTGTYTMNTTGEDVTYELKYEAKDGHLLVTYVNNEIFSEDDVFDSEYSFKDAKTLIIKDSFGEELTFVKK